MSDVPRLARPPLTKIIATCGPATQEPAMLRRLVEAGVSIFRLNFSHGELDEHATMVRRIRAAGAEVDRPVAILGDLPGPKIRIGRVHGGGVNVETGDRVWFDREAPDGGGEGEVRLASTYGALVDDVASGHRLLVNDGAVRMLVVDADGRRLECRVTQGGRIETGKGINLPDSTLSAPAITERDWALVGWAIEHDLDALALSFVSCADDVRRLVDGIAREARRRELAPLDLPVIAKIERPRAVENIVSIVGAADGVMIARGDLGVEMDLARVPVIQRRILQAAQDHARPCIVATQMLETMIHHPQPTRAEASDVANAIFDEADAIMLSGETAVGRWPALAVDTMRRIAEATEAHLAASAPRATPPSEPRASQDPRAALAHAAWIAAQDSGARLLIVWSQTGGGARHLSQNNFRIPIVAVSSDHRALRQMQMLRGVTPMHMDPPAGLGAFTSRIDRRLLESGWAAPGDRCVIVAGWPLGRQHVANALALHRVGEPGTGFAWHDAAEA